MGDRKKNLQSAWKSIAEIKDVSITKTSSLYAAAPVGVIGQNNFLNAVLEIQTQIDAGELLRRLNHIESGMGRERKIKWDARNIDLDILLFGRQVIMNCELTVPHPEMVRRKFVIIPLMEIGPSTYHPIVGKTIAEIWNGAPQDVKEQQVTIFEKQGWEKN